MDLKTQIECLRSANEDFGISTEKMADEIFELSDAEDIDDYEGAKEVIDKIVKIEPDQGLSDTIANLLDELAGIVGLEDE